MTFYSAYLLPFTEVSSVAAAYFLSNFNFPVSNKHTPFSVKFFTTVPNNLIELRNMENSYSKKLNYLDDSTL